MTRKEFLKFLKENEKEAERLDKEFAKYSKDFDEHIKIIRAGL